MSRERCRLIAALLTWRLLQRWNVRRFDDVVCLCLLFARVFPGRRARQLQEK